MGKLFFKARSADAGARACVHAAGAGYACEDVAMRHETRARVDRAGA
jgi:hypothetical protein